MIVARFFLNFFEIFQTERHKFLFIIAFVVWFLSTVRTRNYLLYTTSTSLWKTFFYYSKVPILYTEGVYGCCVLVMYFFIQQYKRRFFYIKSLDLSKKNSTLAEPPQILAFYYSSSLDHLPILLLFCLLRLCRKISQVYLLFERGLTTKLMV